MIQQLNLDMYFPLKRIILTKHLQTRSVAITITKKWVQFLQEFLWTNMILFYIFIILLFLLYVWWCHLKNLDKNCWNSSVCRITANTSHYHKLSHSWSPNLLLILTNLRFELINLYSPWNHQNIYGFLMISWGMENS